MKKQSGLRTIITIVAILIVLVFIFFATGSLYVYFKGNDLLKEYIVNAIVKSSGGVYHLQLKKLNINLLTGRINLSEFHLIPDTNRYNIRSKNELMSPLLVDVSISSFQIRGIDIIDIIMNRKVDISGIVIKSPELKMILKRPVKKPEKSIASGGTLSLPLPKGLVSLRIRQIKLTDGKLTLIDQTKQPAEQLLVPHIDIIFDNLLINNSYLRSDKILNTDDIRIKLNGILLTSKKWMYSITPGEVQLSTANSSLSVYNLKISPDFPRGDFSRKPGYQTDRMEIGISRISIQKLDLKQFLTNRSFIAGSILVDGLNINDYRDKRIPLRKGFKPPLPQQALLNATQYIRIDSIRLLNGKVTYSEQVGQEPGSVFFDKINGTIFNVTNDSVLVSNKTILTVKASMFVMGKGELKAVLEIPVGAKNNAFRFSASLSEMDLVLVNPMLTRIFPAEILSGTVIKMEMKNVIADNNRAIGKMLFFYKDLKLKVNSKDKSTWNKIKSGSMSLAANMYVRKENPKNGKFTEGIIYFERDKRKSIFNFLWKSTFSGLKSTVGINKKEQKEIRKTDNKNK